MHCVNVGRTKRSVSGAILSMEWEIRFFVRPTFYCFLSFLMESWTYTHYEAVYCTLLFFIYRAFFETETSGPSHLILADQ